MWDTVTSVLLFLVLFFSNGIQAITGFAGTLLAMPPCIRLIGADNAKTVLNILAQASCLMILLGSLRCVNWRELGAVAASLGCHKGILVADPFFLKSGLADKLVQESGDTLVAVYGAISPNPDVTEVDACAAAIRESGADFVVALGGGSSMDCAKAASVTALSGESITRYHGTGIPVPREHLPIIAVPTTAGTGSEVTCVSVLTNHAEGKKCPINSNSFYPAVALIDPELTASMPPKVTASTGIDVLCHALEGFWSRGHQPVCDALALHACELVFRWLPVAWADGGNLEAREKMAEASVIAGLAFTLPKTTSSHACSFPLTNLYHIPHVEACGLTLDYFARVNANCEGGRVQAFARKLGFADVSAMADAIHQLKVTTGLRCDLRDLALTDEQIDELVRISHHPNLLNNPVEITDEILYDMYHSFR